MAIHEKIKELLENDDRVIKVDTLNKEAKKNITLIEMKRLNEMVPLINKGVEEALNEDNALVIIKDKTDVIVPVEEQIPTLTLMSENGTLIGEEVYDSEELEDLRNDPSVYFISEYFATYPNLSTPGEKQFFVVSQLRGELSCEDKIEELVSSLSIAAPSTKSDHYIKDMYEMEYTDRIITIILGYSL